jgi:hypothetical protein
MDDAVTDLKVRMFRRQVGNRCLKPGSVGRIDSGYHLPASRVRTGQDAEHLATCAGDNGYLRRRLPCEGTRARVLTGLFELPRNLANSHHVAPYRV